MADKKDDVILNEEDQKLSEEEKQNYETSWNSDSKSDTATRKGAKLPEVKSTTPVAEEKQADPSTSRTTVTVKDAAADAEATRKVEDKANQMGDSSKAKTDTIATGKFINPFQKEKEAADKAVEDARILLDRAKQLESKAAKKRADSMFSKDKSFSENLSTFLHSTDANFDKELLGLAKDTEDLAKALGIDVGAVSKTKTIGDTATPVRAAKIKKINEEFVKAAEERLAAAKTKQQEVQANYTKAEEAAKRKAEEAAKRKAEEAAKRKAEKEAAMGKHKAQDFETETEKDETETKEEAEKETEKDETEDSLKKAEELEQKKYQTPADIKKFSNDLNRFVIQAYLNGDFGKKSSPNAIATMGFFILDKIGAALVNASEVARGMSPSAKSQWSNILDKQTELLGKRITANWFLSLSREEQEALIRSGVISGTTGETIYQTIDPNAVSRAEQKDVLEISKLSQEQKGIAQSNVNALLARKSELQTLIAQLKSDQGWEAYAQTMNAVVGTAKGLSSLGITDDSSSSSNKGFSDTLSANVKTGKVTSAFVSGGISNNSSWNNSSAESLSKSNSLNQDALALSKFKTGEDYAKATREAKKAANEQLIKRLEGQIEIIDKCIDSWGKDLGL